MSLRCERSFANGLAIPLIAVVWLFARQMASPFELKPSFGKHPHSPPRGPVPIATATCTVAHPERSIGAALLALSVAAIVSAAAAEDKHLAAVQAIFYSQRTQLRYQSRMSSPFQNTTPGFCLM